jgi:hypothetical protein
MLHHALIPAIEKTLRQARQKIQLLVGLAQKQGAPVRADRSTVESGYDFPLSAVCKFETRLGTLCHSEGLSSFGANCCVETQLCHVEGLFA